MVSRAAQVPGGPDNRATHVKAPTATPRAQKIGRAAALGQTRSRPTRTFPGSELELPAARHLAVGCGPLPRRSNASEAWSTPVSTMKILEDHAPFTLDAHGEGRLEAPRVERFVDVGLDEEGSGFPPGEPGTGRPPEACWTRPSRSRPGSSRTRCLRGDCRERLEFSALWSGVHSPFMSRPEIALLLGVSGRGAVEVLRAPEPAPRRGRQGVDPCGRCRPCTLGSERGSERTRSAR
jgi:hypothetical protein